MTNTARYVGEGRYEWTVSLLATDSVLDAIRHVEYGLDPSFPEPTRVVGSEGRANNFAISDRAVNEFDIKVSVFFKDGRVEPIQYHLKLFSPEKPIDKIDLEPVRTFDDPDPNREVSSLAFSPTDPHLLASASALRGFQGNGSIRLWDSTTSHITRNLPNAGDNRPEDQFNTVAYSPNGILVAVTTEGMNKQKSVLRLWDVNKGGLPRTLGPTDLDLVGAEGLAFSPDSRMIAIGAGNGIVYLYDTGTGALIKSLKHPGVITSLAFSKGGDILAVGDRDWHPSVRLWNVRNWTHARDLNPPLASYCEALVFSPDGKTLATGYYRGGVYIWDFRTGTILQTMRYKNTEGGQSRTLVFSPDGRFLTFVSNHRLQFWHPASGKLLGDFDIDATSLALRPDGLFLATTTANAKSIQLWQLRY